MAYIRKYRVKYPKASIMDTYVSDHFSGYSKKIVSKRYLTSFLQSCSLPLPRKTASNTCQFHKQYSKCNKKTAFWDGLLEFGSSARELKTKSGMKRRLIQIQSEPNQTLKHFKSESIITSHGHSQVSLLAGVLGRISHSAHLHGRYAENSQR